MSGPVVVVTGASSGIGAGIARHLGRTGSRVVITGRDAERLEAVADRVRHDASGECTTVLSDVRQADAPQAIVSAALEAHGRIDALVHNAGIYEAASVESADLEALDRHWHVNVRAPYALTQAALPHLQPGSSIIFISSMFAHLGAPDASAYSASKGAVEALIRSMATELGPRGVRVNGIVPGWIKTPMTAAYRAKDDRAEQEISDLAALGRWGTPEDIGPPVAFLISEGAGFVTGVSLMVDGGVSIR